MFKGIIYNIGIITSIFARDNLDKQFCIESPTLIDLKVGDSIACSGVCLTVVDITDNKSFFVDVSEATLKVTNISSWHVGKRVNLEQAMRLSDRVDGHLVQGHVDDVATILAVEEKLNSHVIIFNYPERLSRFIIEKGSVALDGVSLTINSLKEHEFSVNIIPYTWNNTTFKYNNINDKVNLEIDLAAKYINKYLKSR
ncbi:riboflavin synthase [Candidatus Mesenet endosymbiont of Agriotes lineatus]|uniref:riboflavin synthase n=1 Tax=Candidatus Mesenet endosymbiont of Agriotes lineatus TaxID=3077948 RepID=UPI0030CDD7B7